METPSKDSLLSHTRSWLSGSGSTKLPYSSVLCETELLSDLLEVEGLCLTDTLPTLHTTCIGEYQVVTNPTDPLKPSELCAARSVSYGNVREDLQHMLFSLRKIISIKLVTRGLNGD